MALKERVKGHNDSDASDLEEFAPDEAALCMLDSRLPRPPGSWTPFEGPPGAMLPEIFTAFSVWET